MAHLLIPEYGRSTLGEVLPAVAAHLAPELGSSDVLGLAAAKRYVLVMVDGLGHQLLHRTRARAPYLAELLDHGLVLTSAVPATTATSLSTLGTGCEPGRHGIVGYTFRAMNEIINALTWDDRLDPLDFQPEPTWFEALQALGSQSARFRWPPSRGPG